MPAPRISSVVVLMGLSIAALALTIGSANATEAAVWDVDFGLASVATPHAVRLVAEHQAQSAIVPQQPRPALAANDAEPLRAIWEVDFHPAVTPSAPLIAAAVAPAADETISAAAPDAPVAGSFSPRATLIALANELRNIRYKRGGSEPATGFDCSGFVRYVFEQGLGAKLPNNSAAQFHAGHKVDRNELRSGDLVFFRIAGKRISHVGIYVDHGRFIHAPSAGKAVRIDSLSHTYWAKRFAGAKRPDILVLNDGQMLSHNT